MLSDLQIRMLREGRLHVDGWCKPGSLEALADLGNRGLMRVWESGSDEQQYTCINGEITEAGRSALSAAEPAKDGG